MFNISDVANLLGIKRLTEGNSFNVVCPFCGDTRGKMNFRIVKDGELANTYHCFKCGAHGNMLTLYADLMGICGVDRYKIAIVKLRRRCMRALAAETAMTAASQNDDTDRGGRNSKS
ncbi:CHC2 zinc finger domain-containing protein [Enterocloster sp.]|uniref:CHC2 zinc finger domain-containing protein n=1 Tax=Enterocloster sp. TaxID=2719315 RepID=UPI0039A3F04D